MNLSQEKNSIEKKEEQNQSLKNEKALMQTFETEYKQDNSYKNDQNEKERVEKERVEKERVEKERVEKEKEKVKDI